MSYRVITDKAELPQGTRFDAEPVPVKPGDLALFEINKPSGKLQIIGRWFPDVAGCDWIIQPSRWIQFVSSGIDASPLRIIGKVAPVNPSPRQLAC
jgi:hypothetical protein